MEKMHWTLENCAKGKVVNFVGTNFASEKPEVCADKRRQKKDEDQGAINTNVENVGGSFGCQHSL